MALTAYGRKKKAHKEAMARKRALRQQKRDRVMEILLKHRESNPDTLPTNIKGWELGEDGELICLKPAKEKSGN